MPDKKLIQKKIQEILQQLEHLQLLIPLSNSELFGKAQNFYFAERVMERLIGAAIDINMHFASDLANDLPEDYFASFLFLARLKILPPTFAKKIAPSASLRNILAHEYQDLDEKKFRNSLKIALKQYQQYVFYIEKFLED